MEIIRGTTPVIEWTFKTNDPSKITVAFLVLEQREKDVVIKDISTCFINENNIQWILSQEETLALRNKVPCQIKLDYLLEDGTRWIGETKQVDVCSSAIDEVIE